MPISENAKAVLERRYLARDEQGQPTETVDGLFRRVANALIPRRTWWPRPRSFMS